MTEQDATAPARSVAGRYRLVRELGRGGMGVVWLATDELAGRQVAVKELRPARSLSPAGRDRFTRRALAEARNAARISHPGAVTLHDILPATSSDDAVYLIMEYVPGPTIAQLITRHGPLPAAHVAAWGLQLLSVLDAAHALGIVHRDVKPGNIIIGQGGLARLTDFGIAHAAGDPRLTSGGVLGTEAYMAPELLEDGPITPAADLWSLGATLQAAVDGRSPFFRENPGATVRTILLGPVPAPACPAPLAAAITSLLQRDPGRRAAGQVRAQLQQAAADLAARPAPPQASLPATAQTPAPGPPAQGQPPLSGYQPSPPAQGQPPLSGYQPGPPAQGQPRRILSGRPGRRPLVIAAIAAAAALVIAAAIVVPVLLRSPGPKPAAATSPGTPPAGPGRAATATPQVPAETFTDPSPAGLSNPVAFSPDGTLVASGAGGTPTGAGISADVWNVATGKLAAALVDPGAQTGGPASVAFSPDGKTLAVGDYDGSVYLWDVASHQLTATLSYPGHDTTGPIANSVAFSPDGTMLASGNADGNSYVWDVAGRALIATLAFPGTVSDRAVTSVAFARGGHMLAAGDLDGSTFLWNPVTGTLAATLTPARDAGVQVNAVAFSPDGKVLAAGTDNGTYIWDLGTRTTLYPLSDPGGPDGQGRDVRAVAFSHDNHVLATGDGNDDICLWTQGGNPKPVTILHDPGGTSAYVGSVAFSPDDATLAAGDENSSTYLWHLH